MRCRAQLSWRLPVRLAATGHAVDIDRIDFLDESLRMRIETVEKTPVLLSDVNEMYRLGIAPTAAQMLSPSDSIFVWHLHGRHSLWMKISPSALAYSA
jgi:hypothetical protein